MSNVLVSIIGDQPAPNIFLIRDKTFQHIDSYIFIITDLMEKKKRLDHLLRALAIPINKFRKIKITADKLSAIKQELDTLKLLDTNDQYHVNISSGSKIMSIGVYNYFTQENLKERSRLYYLSIREDAIIQVYPEKKNRIPLSYRISVKEYLTSHGVRVNDCKGIGIPFRSFEIAEKFRKLLAANPILSNGITFRKSIGELRKHFNDHNQVSITLGPDSNFLTLIEEISFIRQQADQLSKEEVEYLIGGWFEEWVYYYIKKQFQLTDATILGSVKIQRLGQTDNYGKNEFDIMFTYKNALYVIECKSGLGGYNNAKRLFDASVHRLAALRNDFGLKVRTSFITLSKTLRNPKGILKPAIKSRAILLDINFLDGFDLEKTTERWVAQILGGH